MYIAILLGCWGGGGKDVFNRILVKVVFALFLFLPTKEVFPTCSQSQGVGIYLINLKESERVKDRRRSSTRVMLLSNQYLRNLERRMLNFAAVL